MTPTVAGLLADLSAEHRDLDQVVEHLDDDAWRRPTPSEGWSVADQIGHLAFFDRRAALAMSDPEAFAADRAELVRAAPHDPSVDLARRVTAAELLDEWRSARSELIAAVPAVAEGTRVPWYGPPMSLASFLTARLMETWAHGQDVADAVGVTRGVSDRLRHVAHIGVGARAFSLMINGLAADERPVVVRLVAPSGELWQWGSTADAASVSGDALDFCLVVTRRRRLDESSLVIEGEAAEQWMRVAQAFAGPPGRIRDRRSS